MGVSDRILNSATFDPIVEKPPASNKSPDIKQIGGLTINQKTGLIDIAFSWLDDDVKIESLVNDKKLKNLKSLKKTAKQIDKIRKQSFMSFKNQGTTLKEIGKIDSENLLTLTKLIKPSGPIILKSKKSKSRDPPNFFMAAIINAAKEGKLRDNSVLDLMDPDLKNTFLTPTFGYLHLERLRFEPVGDVKGERLYSLPIEAGAESFISKKTWSKTSKEFVDIVSNEIEKEITTQRTESSELSESVENQSEYSAKLSASAEGSGTYGVCSFSGSVSADLSTSISNINKRSTKRNMNITNQTSSRTKKQYKTTFQSSTEIGVEDEFTKKVVNPNKTQAIQYDYYRLMTDWKISLERYGVRLTMDVMVEDPGFNLRREFDERKELETIANGTYTCSISEEDIDEDNLPEGIDAKPRKYTTNDNGSADPRLSHSGEKDHTFTIRSGYEIDSVDIDKTGGGGHAKIEPSKSHYKGKTGTVKITVHRGVATGEDRVSYTVEVTAKPTAATISDWKNSVINALCQKEKEQWDSRKVEAQNQLDELVSVQGELSSLELRKEERVEIMAGVAKSFLIGSYELDSAPDEVVKFVHEAFEWENVNYFLYPYFWKRMENALKIKHPDALRKDFLKSSWARVLLPIRDGYEKKVLAFAYAGDLNSLSVSSHMRSVAEQIMHESKSTYAYTISPENESEEKFETISTWNEYTPTDAETISVKLIDGNIAEPYLSDKLDAEINKMTVEYEIKRKIESLLESLPEEMKIKSIKSGDSEEVELFENNSEDEQ